ncbi:hypothetical protein DV451_003798 [Geotrichum candidum]|uniref:chitin synthase n=1 Tax=Geotrichum candidum TaxID=1173061 RepID=A0A9P5G2G0_GEOCN|nr:hypothetical protein DV451_003798 [Geotrichum candidum]
MNVQPSATGNDPNLQDFNSNAPPIQLSDMSHHVNTPVVRIDEEGETESVYDDRVERSGSSHSARPQNDYRYSEESETSRSIPSPYTSQNYGKHETHVNTVDADTLLNTKRNSTASAKNKKKDEKAAGPPPSLWRTYCFIVTFWAPSFLMKYFGMPTRDRQIAWREKIGLITIILYVAAFVAYLTFGFTTTVCNNNVVRMRNNEVSSGNLIIHGHVYDLTQSKHPAAHGVPPNSNILYPPVNAGGRDASFLFQNVNGHCLNVLTPRDNSSIPSSGNDLAYYMPCKTFAQDGSTQANFTSEYYDGWACHTSTTARKALWNLKSAGEVYFTWEDVRNTSRNLIVFNGNVIDLDLINWIDTDSINVPQIFYDVRDDANIKGVDVSQIYAQGEARKMVRCLSDIAMVGYVDADQIGCLASKVVLYVSLVFIIGIVAIKFLFAIYFKWFVTGKQGANYMNLKTMAKHEQEVEDWSNNMYAQGPVKNAPKAFPQSTQGRVSMFRPRSALPSGNVTMGSQLPSSSTSKLLPSGTYLQENLSSRASVFNTLDDPYRSSKSITGDTSYVGATDASSGDQDLEPGAPGYLVPQPPVDYQPFGFPLAHTICLVTAYSESVEGLRTTLDSVATTDYPNSHKLILVICDGLIKGSGNDMTTPEIALSMMKDFVEPPDQVQAYSYVSVVSGMKRHNMAKVYAGFYDYDNDTMDPSKQQRVPMITIVKCGTPAEQGAAKPGNRGKRDGQVILMSFLQRVMFDERMTELEYEMFNGIWKVAGVAPDFYEIVLMVDADTKVFPDSITHMVGQMVKDPEIMGLCGETKISNKSDSWVTMIQVFEYFISHHQSKAFESMFGGVTCLPGCFCMYRIKAPKGEEGYWVPILANPDIVEHYSENVVDTLHKKNLLLLGEDRYLSTLMLRTFPKRKQIFIPKAACKTIVPDEFKVLLSQRRRWINSTVHNLMELVLVRDLCGVFCISMQFVVFIELVGTLVLPAAIAFTIYVIIIAIVKKPTPVLSLVLLALILGLPGVLIVVTASRPSYILWMFIYLLSLPVWNFVLPCYAYWKFDDFSWGDTRTIAGGDKGGHDDDEGEFDSSQIVMKRWRDFERDNHRFQQQQMQQPWESSSPPSAGFRSQTFNSGTPVSEYGGLNDYNNPNQQHMV